MSNFFGGVKPSSPSDNKGTVTDPNMVEIMRVQQKLERMGFQLDKLADRVEEMNRLLMDIKSKK